MTADELLLPTLRPVDTATAPLPARLVTALAGTQPAQARRQHAGRHRLGVGRHVPLADLADDVIDGPAIVSVDAATDFEVAAREISDGACEPRLAHRRGDRRAGRRGADPQPHPDRRAGGRRGRPRRPRAGGAGRGRGRRAKAAPIAPWPTRSRCRPQCSLGQDQIHDVAEFTRELADSPAIAVTPRTGPPQPPAPDDDYVDCTVGGEVVRYTPAQAHSILRLESPGSVVSRAPRDRSPTAERGWRSTTRFSPIWRRSTTVRGCGAASPMRAARSWRCSPPTTSPTRRRHWRS